MSFAIDTLVIPTRDPAAADAVVRWCMRSAAATGRPLRSIVCDGGDPTRAIALVEALVARGCERDVLEFALLDPLSLAPRAGANRNLAQLLTLGCRVAVLDDDLGPRTFRTAASATPRLVLDADPTEYWFFRTTADADALVDDVDPVAALERGLALDVPTELPAIAASWIGVAGDPGSPSGLFWLVQRGASRERLGRDDGSYLAARASRRVMRAVTAPTIGAGHGWTPAAVAYDHRGLLPPFLPVLRGQGLVWGATVYAGAAWTLARMPGAIEHRLAAPLAIDPRVQRASTLGMAVGTVLQTALTMERLGGAPDPRTALVGVGQRLADLAATRDRFAQWLAFAIEARARGLAGALQEALERLESRPAAWVVDVEQTIDALGRVHAEPELVPYDLADRPDARELLRHIVQRFARLLSHWPDVVDVARTLD